MSIGNWKALTFLQPPPAIGTWAGETGSGKNQPSAPELKGPRFPFGVFHHPLKQLQRKLPTIVKRNLRLSALHSALNTALSAGECHFSALAQLMAC